MAKPRILRTVALALAATGLVISCLPQDVSARELRQYRRPWRSGVVSFGIQGQYGYNTGETALTDPFDWGPGLAINARYAISKRYSLGVRFEVHNFGAREDSVDAMDIFAGGRSELLDQRVGIDELRITTAGLDLYVYFNRGKETMNYLNFSSGLYQLSVLLSEDPFNPIGRSARIERDHLYVMGGAGLEHFLRRSVALDINGKVFAYLGDTDGIPLGLELAAGLQVYFFD
jgi:hypothetical protein